MSPEHYAQCGICCWSWWLTEASWKQILCSDWPVVLMLLWINLLCSPPGIEVHYSYIHKLLWVVCASKALLLASHFSFCPYIPPYPSLPPFWSRCTVIPLPSHLLHPHAHLLSVSRWATFWSRERTSDEKESLLFNQIPLWFHPHI